LFFDVTMNTAQIREAFLNYFQSKQHQIVKSSALVPENDPTLLFTNAGMNQFKDLFLGSEKRSYSRATSAQKVLRISGKHNDLENVGVTARHHTFFEMLGNFSFGDYFKSGAIEYAWEFITKVLKLPESRLWVTVYEKDDEAFELWQKLAGVKADRILRCGESDNFWSMGDTGPCGPCTEIHFYIGDKPEAQSEAEFRKGDGQYLEFWNLVFMQYNRDKQGNLTPLPRQSVDTGMGLERIASIVQGKTANYDNDLLRALITRAESISSISYNGSSYQERDVKQDRQYAYDIAMRVLADHSRSITFLIADGVQPASDGRGYVLRRLIRRAVRHGRVLGLTKPFLSEMANAVIKLMSEAYPELNERQAIILKLIQAEEIKFSETLDSGLGILRTEVEKLKAGEKFPALAAFILHDTYGFPLDLTQDALKAYKLEVDVEGFEKAMQEQRSRSREDRKGRDISYLSVKVDAPKTHFLGYEELKAEAKLAQILSESDNTDNFPVNSELGLIFDATPFYAESGGQVGDSGIIEFSSARLKVLDTQKLNHDYYVHQCQLLEGQLSRSALGQKASLSVDCERRQRIRASHSATHLVHSALRKVLGEHVKQAGSRVDDHSSRFDYSHFSSVSQEELELIQSLVNQEIRANHEVQTRVLPIEEARKTGAIALFGEKYGDKVRVVEIGAQSVEFCGGTHVKRSGDIGSLILLSEGGISAGTRRIECLAGAPAIERLLKDQRERQQIASLLKGDSNQIPDKLEKLLERTKQLESQLSEYKSKLALNASNDLIKKARTSSTGIRVVSEAVSSTDIDTLKSMVDELRTKIGSGVVALAANTSESGVIVIGITQDLSKRLNAGNIVKEIIKVSGGRGGGKAEFAQAGGVASLELALSKVFDLIP
jgi:alanyl-tRNA synthetase